MILGGLRGPAGAIPYSITHYTLGLFLFTDFQPISDACPAGHEPPKGHFSP